MLIDQGADVHVGQHVARGHYEGVLQAVLQQLHRSRRAGRDVLEAHDDLHPELIARAQRLHHVLGAVPAGEEDLFHPRFRHRLDDILHARTAQHGQERFGPGVSQRSKPRPLAAGEDHRLTRSAHGLPPAFSEAIACTGTNTLRDMEEQDGSFARLIGSTLRRTVWPRCRPSSPRWPGPPAGTWPS